MDLSSYLGWIMDLDGVFQCIALYGVVPDSVYACGRVIWILLNSCQIIFAPICLFCYSRMFNK